MSLHCYRAGGVSVPEWSEELCCHKRHAPERVSNGNQVQGDNQTKSGSQAPYDKNKKKRNYIKLSIYFILILDLFKV